MPTSPDPDGEVGVMKFGLKGTSRVYRRHDGEVGIVEFGLQTAMYVGDITGKSA